MNAVAWALLGLTGAIAVLDWFSVIHSSRRLEYVAKPLVMVGLIAVALALNPVSNLERWLFVIALVLGLVSDVFLMLPGDRLLPGLVAALVEHVAYIAGFRARDLDAGLLAIAAVIAVASAAILAPSYYRALRKNQPKLVVPVFAYMAIFIAMVASAGGTGSFVALGGALLFYYSDALLGWYRFVNPLPWGRPVNIVAYHLGQALLVLSLVH
ncbi:MAG TPA: lysoplasmalogenase [Candidatus Dormibacteraeota bacterium]|nr:lysoplasmalogenase [Candidatus Dormibacteraeota bacterium]